MAPSVEDRIKNLKIKREAFRLELNEIKDLLDAPELCSNPLEMKFRLEELAAEYVTFLKTQSELDFADDTGVLMRERIQLKTFYSHCRARAQQFINEHTSAIPCVNFGEGSSGKLRDFQATPQSIVEALETEIQLPKIRLPIFSGKFEDWPGFANQFRYTVHDNPRLNECKNYAVAWSILEGWYNQPSVIVSNHLQVLFELPQVVKATYQDLKTFLTTVESRYRSLMTMKQPTTDTLLIHLFLSKIDEETGHKWLEATKEIQFPMIDSFFKFLHDRCQVLGPSPLTVANQSNQSNQFNQSPMAHNLVSRPQYMHRMLYKPATRDIRPHAQQAFKTQTTPSCNFCTGSHYSQQCESLTRLSVPERITMVKGKGLCINCFRANHKTTECRSSLCRQCHKKHHSLLHLETRSAAGPSTQVNTTALKTHGPSQVLLATACIDIVDPSGGTHRCRVLLDSGSQSHFLTNRFAREIGLKSHNSRISLTGMNDMMSSVNSYTKAQIRSRRNDFSRSLTFLLVNDISQQLPTETINKKSLNIPKNIYLADPKFYERGDIDGLLGAQLFWELLYVGQISLPSKSIKLQKTQLGWIVTGEIIGNKFPQSVGCNIATDSLTQEVYKFWELEECRSQKHLSIEEQACEAHYSKTVKRNSETGRYSVRLPFKQLERPLGDSYPMAVKRFLSLERSLNKNPETKERYVQFLDEYKELGHMSELPSRAYEGYFLPHHAVIKADSITTKIRVVFDASAKTNSGTSLNDTLMIGPVVQDDLYSIVCRFRLHKYVLTADIAKMYRQIQLDEKDRKYHQILWRSQSDQPIKTFQLNTVTYGTACAPYLATRTLMQLAIDEYASYPKGARVLKEDFYVDDMLTGADELTEVAVLRDELISLTNKGGFQLRQWASNEPQLLESLKSKAEEHMVLNFADEKKTLGLVWTPKGDNITYSIKNVSPLVRVTKRQILSQIAQLFDPLGLLGPIIVQAKIIMQSLWKIKLDWDETVPFHINTAWNIFHTQLINIQKINIPRRIVANNHISLQLHGFCDASEVAYGACLYIRTTDTQHKHYTHLVCSKTRVAPLKSQSLPRLELCAAVLLIRLYDATIKALNISFDKVSFWTDSMITLHWINTQPHKLKQFIANRVSEIQQSSRFEQWNHVSSKDNIADKLSRGMNPEEFLHYVEWESGPQWLSLSEGLWPVQKLQHIDVPEQRKIVVLSTTTKETFIFHKFSSFMKLKRVVAYCYRFYHKALKRQSCHGQLSIDEVNQAHDRIIKLIQTEAFGSDFKELTSHKAYKGKLQPLSPFIDSNGMIRVGGRLVNADLSYDQKHQLLLPNKHVVTSMIIREYHMIHGHTGIQATLNIIRQKYWPIHGKTNVKSVIHKCVVCHRAKPMIPTYPMGNLPTDRVTFNRPFLTVGIDYCGPFFIKEKRLRNTKKIKCYVAIFVCFSTKAIHIELVSDLTTDAFLAALRRFFARRGKCTDIYSDNGTNFIGADREIQDIYKLVCSETHNSVVQHYLTNLNIQWHFIPPRAPHFGGLWEVAVKSVKTHMVKILKNTVLTYEAFYTCLTEIEAILNSRPITPLSSDPSDITALTTGHFLIGDLIVSIPECDFTQTNAGRLSQWQHIQQIRQHFWERWRKEYLHELTVRHRWHESPSHSIREGTMMILKEDNLPPLCWPLGRVIDIHPGDDGVIRVVTVKTITGTYKRCVKKLSPLPISNDSV